MSLRIDRDALYTETHEWMKMEGEIAVAGITDYAQDQLSEIVYVEFTEVGDSFERSDVYGVVESVKAASDCYLPIGGEIVEVNEALEESPQLVNEDPYGEGWFVKFKPTNPSDAEGLMNAEAYEEFCAKEAEKDGGH